MPDFDSKKFEALLDAGNKDEAKVLLSSFFDQELSKVDKGRILVETAMTYMRVRTEINKKYIGSLDELISIINTIDRKQSEVKSKIDITSIRNQIDQL
jgi:hypothetical protein